MFTRVSLMDSNPGKSPIALANEVLAGLHALDGEEQNNLEVRTGARLQQRAPKAGEGGEGGEGGVEPGAPALSSLAPNEAVVGSTDFLLRLLGTGFADGCTIVWNGADEITNFVSETELTTGVKPSTASGPSTVTVAVRNPDDQISNELPFTFTAAEPGAESSRKGEANKGRGERPAHQPAPGRPGDEHARPKRRAQPKVVRG